ncbi:hypothetical protein HYPSUDRAFT_206923 [Hypholoma sublateritium FD-334 SS-4]|uniref:Uncharacterized protein n=1 Tax=Hypholoma sublateritium (strain FD-334 SS-4) TaxID=945553 RepID=A0A0D2P840_HYPSF|nr:hypothetical protein HYPSUDRAFT_206923 [Hypholoma sublateritium FD-334 SS-4]
MPSAQLSSTSEFLITHTHPDARDFCHPSAAFLRIIARAHALRSYLRSAPLLVHGPLMKCVPKSHPYATARAILWIWLSPNTCISSHTFTANYAAACIGDGSYEAVPYAPEASTFDSPPITHYVIPLPAAGTRSVIYLVPGAAICVRLHERVTFLLLLKIDLNPSTRTRDVECADRPLHAQYVYASTFHNSTRVLYHFVSRRLDGLGGSCREQPPIRTARYACLENLMFRTDNVSPVRARPARRIPSHFNAAQRAPSPSHAAHQPVQWDTALIHPTAFNEGMGWGGQGWVGLGWVWAVRGGDAMHLGWVGMD